MTGDAEAVRRAMGGPVALYRLLRDLDDAWVAVAAAWGFGVVREPGAYVSYLGDDVIRAAPYDDLDPDDCLAQIVLHELCHFAVEGPGSRAQWDWGLDNISDADVGSEHAAVRVQAAVLDPFGLREVLAPTTDFRSYYDALPDDPFEGPAEVVSAARQGFARLRGAAGWAAVRDALERTARAAAS